MKFEKLQPGMTVHDVSRQKMGNTTMTTMAVHPVHIVSVDPEKRTVVARWNALNEPRTFRERSYSKWRADKPVLIGRTGMPKRLATPAERKEIERAAAARVASADEPAGCKPK